MKIFYHELKSRWHKLSIYEQMANIGAEVGRAISWRRKNNTVMSRNALYRALELIDFTIDDKKNKNSLGEILRVRELLVDDFMGKNIYQGNDTAWEKYFFPFNLAAQKMKV